MSSQAKRITIRDVGYIPGVLPSGPLNSILDVPGVHISQVTMPTKKDLPPGCIAAKGVTVISPRPPQEFYKPCQAGKFTFNGNGELTASRQIEDWGFTNMPISFTNSLSLGTVFDGTWDWVLDQQDRFKWDELTKARQYGTPVVGETADWMINSDLRASRLDREDIRLAFENLKSADDGAFVEEGQRGGGAGMTCHMYAGGTGTASRVVGGGEGSTREYTVGVLIQSNYGRQGDLIIGGVPIGKILAKENEAKNKEHDEGADVHAPPSKPLPTDLGGRTKDGSILMLIITDAPLASHQLNRLARHATVGLTLVGGYGVGRNFSGDIFLALSTADNGPQQLEGTKMRTFNPTQTYQSEVVKNESIDPYFYAVAEAVEEAVLNSMVGGRSGTRCMSGTEIAGFPMDKIRSLLDKHLVKV
ncbi:Hypothetical protein R9X50_00084500 [Acrodontium crateriforme]|uniref:Uncharacterized protein n=1 Tax=Acrodontium crateriforme TaxID=150365 RepID=A0AAQ3M1C4_9PEZI|nr:Hypothetical protein R9X50_00084500 [Acrodontium crateriforme]